MKIVITDGFTVNPGDLSWESIASFGSLETFDRTPINLLVERCKEADIILSNKVPFSRETLMQLPALRMIGVMATGYNVIDAVAAREMDIAVCNAPAYGTASVAQHTIALMLELTNQIGLHDRLVKAGEWKSSLDWAFARTQIIELKGKTLGLVGFGNIGSQVDCIAMALGMKVFYFTPSVKTTKLGEYKNLEDIFSESDIVSLHCPLLPANMQFVNKSLIDLMKPSAFLINTARGQLINEIDLAEALIKGGIAGAALDVLSSEPPVANNPLLHTKNCIITPHNAWMSKEARTRIIAITTQNISSFLQNDTLHRVN